MLSPKWPPSEPIMCSFQYLWGNSLFLGADLAFRKFIPKSVRAQINEVWVIASGISCHSIAARETTTKTSGTHDSEYYLAHGSTGFGWTGLGSADLGRVCFCVCGLLVLRLLMYLGSSGMMAGWNGLTLEYLGTQLCLTCLSSSRRLAEAYSRGDRRGIKGK